MIRRIVNGQQVQAMNGDGLHKRPIPNGIGFFETMRWSRGKIPLFPAHLHRLTKSMHATGLSHTDFDPALNFEAAISELTSGLSHVSHLKIRMGIVRVITGQSMEPTEGITEWFVEAIDSPSYDEFDESPCHAGFYSIESKHYTEHSGRKSLNDAIYTAAEQVSHVNKLDEIFIQNTHGRIIESEKSNVFVWNGTELNTPALSEGCIEGVYRNHVLHVCKAEGIPFKESSIEAEELIDAKEILLCNALRGIRSVTKLHEKNYPTDFARFLFEICRKHELH